MKKFLNVIFLMTFLQSCFMFSSKNWIDLESLDDKSSQHYQLKKGEKLYIKIRVHGSVGYTAEYNIDDASVIKLKDESINYDRPNFKGSGGDSAFKEYIFEGVNVGSTSITIKKIFRGEIEKEFVLRVEVSE